MDDAYTRTGFDALLALLDNDRDAAGAKYEELRLRLVRYFEWRGCASCEDLADTCFDRVIKKIAESEDIQNVAAYTAAVAQFVYKESLRSPTARTDSIDDTDAVEIASGETVPDDGRMDCLERCLNEFSAEDRRLIVGYYDTDEKTMIDSRKRLADMLSLSMNILRIKVCRLKARLEKCTRDCCMQTAA